MKTSSPLYFTAADVMAAFSVADEPASPAAVPSRRSATGPAPWTMALAGLLSAHAAVAQAALWRWFETRVADAKRPLEASARPAADRERQPMVAFFADEERPLPLSCSGLTSHFALAAPAK